MNTDTAPMLTLSHLYGSGGSLIARGLGRRLHWTVWNKEIVRQIASQRRVDEEHVESMDERVDSFLDRMERVMGMGGFEMVDNVLPPLWLSDTELAHLTRSLIEEVAKDGHTIIVGRGGQCILAERSQVLHVFIFAPLAARVEQVMRVEGLTCAEAEGRIAVMDRLRAEYVRAFYHADWRDPSHYHLLIDSGMWGETGTANLIAQALQQRSGKWGARPHADRR